MAKIITLPSGQTATIREAKGRDVRTAQKMSGDDTSSFMNCFMSLCVEIEGAKLVPEQFDDLAAADYLNLLSEFSDINFPSSQNT